MDLFGFLIDFKRKPQYRQRWSQMYNICFVICVKCEVLSGKGPSTSNHNLWRIKEDISTKLYVKWFQYIGYRRRDPISDRMKEGRIIDPNDEGPQ